MDNPQIKNLADKAVDSALSNNWQKAIDFYKKILTIEKLHLDAILGLAFAYLQTNNVKEAKKYYKKALVINPTNTIAINNLDRIKTLEKKGGKHTLTNSHVVMDPNLFINISGKTKVITLTNIGQVDIIAKLKVGEQVNLNLKRRRLEVRNYDGEYIGALPDDVSKRLIYFLNAKSSYSVYIKSALRGNVEVFIREDKKGSKVAHFVSFPKNIQENLKSMIGEPDDEDLIVTDTDEESTEVNDEEKDEEITEETAHGVNETDIDWLADNEEVIPEIISQKDDDSEEFEE